MIDQEDAASMLAEKIGIISQLTMIAISTGLTKEDIIGGYQDALPEMQKYVEDGLITEKYLSISGKLFNLIANEFPSENEEDND